MSIIAVKEDMESMITKKEFCSKIDHSCLGWICERELVRRFCDEAVKYGFATVCMNPDQVAFASSVLMGRAGISCVVGFPCGANTAKIKIAEGLEAIGNGATDIDVVTNLSMLRDGEDRKLAEEYSAIVAAVRDRKPGTVVKFIIYAPYGTNPCLTMDETERVASLVVNSSADFIKFICDPDIIKRFTGGKIKMKYSGCCNFDISLDAVLKGCDRIGSDENMITWLAGCGDSFWENEVGK